MIILQDFVPRYIYIERKKFRIPFHLSLSEDTVFVFKLIVFGFAFFSALTISIVFSIPDTKRQDQHQIHHLGRDFIGEPCHVDLELSDLEGIKPFVSTHRYCTY